MNSARTLAMVMLVVVALAGGPMVASADTKTLTVAVETRGGDAVADATVVASWDGGSTSVQTANNGKAFVDVPDSTRVELVIEHENYTRNFPYVVQDTAQVAGEVTVPVSRKASLALTVRDSEGVVPNAQVAVSWNGRLVTSQQTGSEGTISLQTVEAGTYSVRVEKPGYYINETTVTASGTTDATIRLESGGVPYEFNVTDSHFEPPKPVGGVTVTVENVGTVDTSKDGRTTARIPVNSEVDVSITKDGYETVTRTLDVGESGGNVHVDLQRTPHLRITAVNDRVVVGESVVVTVHNEYGEPVANATIRRNGTAVGTTSPDGQAVIPLETAGIRSLDATKDGLTAPAVTVEVIDPDATTTTTATTTTSPSTAATPTPDSTTGIGVPGFGVTTAALALLALAGVGFLRRQ